MTDYPAKSLKYDPLSGAIAIRTIFPDQDPFVVWLAAYPSGQGAKTLSNAAVDSWLDITPPTE